MKNVYTVRQVNSYIKNMFAQDFMLNRIYVKGEVSNLKYHTSGHIYFSLKDESGTIACVMFAGSRSGLSFRMEEGQQIIVLGVVDVYARDGKYQLYARKIVRDGVGRTAGNGNVCTGVQAEDPKVYPAAWSCDCTDRGGSQRHHQYYEAEESFCADHPVSGTGTGRRCF